MSSAPTLLGRSTLSIAVSLPVPSAVGTATTASFEDSLVPMLIADDHRRYLDANRAACLLLRMEKAQVLQLTIDDLTPPGLAEQTAALWDAFLRDGSQSGTFELRMPDGAQLRVDYSATARVEPGRHLSLLYFPASRQEQGLIAASDRGLALLSEREREVLTQIAMGERGAAIALSLGVSPATVETHVRHCLSKLGAKNRAHAITLGLQRGEIAIRLSDS
jgi:DNA-binding CsgD family transcriptional regulator